jgi:Fur family ferric uptake transcriptional regulator
MAKSLSARQLHILAILEASEDELSGQALHVLLKDKQLPMGLATVYRNLRVLQQKGEVRCRHLPSGEALYAPLERDVHHLTCLECGRSIPLPQCPVEEQGLHLHTPAGFTPLFHTLEVFGHCIKCRP